MRVYRFIAGAFTRSLQLRIVVLTILLTIIAIYGVGSFMAQQISRGLFESKLSSVSTQMSGYVSELESVSPGEDDSALSESLNVQLRGMISRSPTPLRSIALEPRERSSQVQPTTAVVGGTEVLAPSAMPPAFRNAVAQSEAYEQLYQSVELPGGGSPGLILAQQVTVPAAGQFDLYVVADLQEEQNTLDFVQRVLMVAALVLVVLVGAVAWTVTRLVVVPVRTGSEVARKLSDGDLDQRMPVAGSDEIATLAQSFNDMADTLQDQITRMERLTVLQRQFVSDVSHELRTPLTTIQMASDMIYETRDELDESHRRVAELLKSQVERFEVLLNDLLEISRHDAGAAQLATKPADVCQVVTGVIDTLTMVADHADTPITLHAPSAPAMAEIDRVRVNRVVRNLLVNAIEHGERRPIDVFVAANAEAVAVSVRDHGVGMSEEQIEHVFDRFWRADPSRRRALGGSGLGLAISLEDAHLHGGWLQAWGREGEGSCFRLTIPRRAGQAITTSPLPLPPADARVSGTVLVAGPATSDGSLRIQTGSIPIVVATKDVADEDDSDDETGGSR